MANYKELPGKAIRVFFLEDENQNLYIHQIKSEDLYTVSKGDLFFTNADKCEVLTSEEIKNKYGITLNN